MFPTDYDSDQSLSEEEDLSHSSQGKYALSLSDPFVNKGPQMQVLSELEKLQKYAYQLNYGTNATISNECQRGPCTEEEIEFPAFNIEDDNINHQSTESMSDMDEKNIHGQRLALASVCNSDEEIVSDDEKTSLNATGTLKLYVEGDAWFGANEELEDLVQVNGSGGPSAKEHVTKDSRTKAKPKFLFGFHSQKEDFPLVVSDKSETDLLQTDLHQNEDIEGGSNGCIQKSMAESLEVFNRREVEQLPTDAILLPSVINNNENENSMARFWDNLQEDSDCLRESGKQPSSLRGRRKEFGFKRSISPWRIENTDEDSLMDDRSSVQDEGNSLISKPPQKTMADLFHEALGAAAPKDVLSEVEIHSVGIGLFDKLQHVMLSEKQKDVDFLERSIVDNCSNDERGCIDVKILTRSLEGKHNVCCCGIVRDKESFHLMNALDVTRQVGERPLTVIFSSRICGDVELEVGNKIRIQPPWKEVAVRGQDGVILLSAYFSQIGI